MAKICKHTTGIKSSYVGGTNTISDWDWRNQDTQSVLQCDSYSWPQQIIQLHKTLYYFSSEVTCEEKVIQHLLVKTLALIAIAKVSHSRWNALGTTIRKRSRKENQSPLLVKEKGKVYLCTLAQISMDESSNLDFDSMNKDVYPFILWGLDWIFSKQ